MDANSTALRHPAGLSAGALTATNSLHGRTGAGWVCAVGRATVRGRIIFTHQAKNYGRILSDTGHVYFFERSHLKDANAFEQGLMVEFVSVRVKEERKLPRAVQIEVLA